MHNKKEGKSEVKKIDGHNEAFGGVVHDVVKQKTYKGKHPIC